MLSYKDIKYSLAKALRPYGFSLWMSSEKHECPPIEDEVYHLFFLKLVRGEDQSFPFRVIVKHIADSQQWELSSVHELTHVVSSTLECEIWHVELQLMKAMQEWAEANEVTLGEAFLQKMDSLNIGEKHVR